MYRLHHVETELSDVNDLYHGTQRRVNKIFIDLQGGQ